MTKKLLQETHAKYTRENLSLRKLKKNRVGTHEKKESISGLQRRNRHKEEPCDIIHRLCAMQIKSKNKGHVK